jgi:glucose-1-phosphate thymidylyltransferase
VSHFTFVIGHLGEKIREYVEEFAAGRFQYHFVWQSPRHGLAHAVHLCRDTVPVNEPVLIALGDTIIDTDLSALFADPHTMLCVQQVDQPWEFGVAVVDEASGFITSLVEKPSIPKSNLALVGLYKIANAGALFRATEELIASGHRTRGEYHLTDALMRMIAAGEQMRVQQVLQWHNCGKKEVLLETNRLLLKKMEQHHLPTHPTAILIPPVFIPDSVTVEHSIVGPYVAVGEHARISHSIVQDSILGSYSALEGIMLRQSVVGSDSRLVGRWNAINIGENTEIDFNL